MVKPFRTNTRHIKVEIRPPDEKKQLDLNDKFDQEEAIKILWQEWKMIEDEVRKSFGIIVIDGKAYLNPEAIQESQDKYLLP